MCSLAFQLYSKCVTLAIIFSSIKSQDSVNVRPDLTSYYDSYGQRLTCVAEGNVVHSGLTFMTPLGFTRRYDFPFANPDNKKRSQYSCLTNNENDCINNWRKKGLLLTHSEEKFIHPVLDERWNSFRKVRTQGETNPTEAYKIKNKNFHISVSVRSKANAQIILCQTKYNNPFSSPCYWILIGSAIDHKNVTALRKCVNGVSETFPRSTEKDCRMLRAEKTYNRQILNEYQWLHYSVKREENTLYLYLINSDYNTAEVVLQYEDSSPIDVTTLYLRSYIDFVAEWRVHDYSFFNLQEENKLISLFTNTKQDTTHACISMFVLVCSSCKLNIIIEADSGQISSRTVSGNYEDMLSWQHLQINFDLNSQAIYTLYIKGTVDGDTSNPVWGIDYITDCFPEEIRFDTIQVTPTDKPNVLCHSLLYPEWTFLQPKNGVNINDIPKCAVPLTGTFCNINCSFIMNLEFCNRNEICRPTLRNNNVYSCTCAPGYFGKSCQDGCEHGFYGYECTNKCGKCKHGNTYCSKPTGICQYGCDFEYTGEFCLITRNPYLLLPPKIINVSYTNATIELENIATTGENSAVTYQVQYKRNTSSVWKWYGERKKFEQYSRTTLTELQKDADYDLRVILYTSSGEYYDKEQIPTTNFTTTCNETLSIVIIPEERGAKVHIIKEEATCDIAFYYFVVNEQQEQVYHFELSSYSVTLQDLLPFHKYELIVHSKKFNYTQSETFQTLEDAPGNIANLTLVRASATSITLSWDQPPEPNGFIRKYTVLYQFIRFLECKGKWERTDYNKTISPFEDIKNVVLDDLHPYSEYQVSVFATTTRDGPPTAQTFETLKEDFISDNELPNSLSAEAHSTYVSVKWDLPSCEHIKGPLLYIITYECENDSWCNGETYTVYFSAHQNSAILGNLVPFSQYILKLRAARSREEPATKSEKYINFRTTAGVPPLVRNLTVYARSVNFISIRWKDPYPPHGRLDKYEITYCPYYYTSYPCTPDSFKLLPSVPCEYWEDYYCYTINKLLHPKYYYIVQIKTYNKDVRQCSKTSVSTIAEEGESSEPVNLTANWEGDNLILTWGHPFIPDGNIESFLISFKQIDSEIAGSTVKYREYIFTTKLNKTYKYQLERTISYSSSYEIRVSAKGISYGKNATITIQTPPETPELTGDTTIEEAANTTITIIIPGVQASTLSKKSYLYVIVGEVPTNSNMKKRAAELSTGILKQRLLTSLPNVKTSWIAGELAPSESPITFVVGSGEKRYSAELQENIINFPLKPDTTYDISIVPTNIYRKQSSFQAYAIRGIQTAATPVESNLALLALLLLLVIPLPIIAYIFLSKKKTRLSSSRISLANINNNGGENLYEPDVIPLTTPSREPQIKPKPVVAPKPSSSKSLMHKDDGNAPLIPPLSNKPDTTNYHSRLVPLNNLETYIREALESGELAQQHALFPRGQTKPWDYGLLKPNKFKNRYNNLIAYDHNRVKLKKINNDEFSDYINASYIHGYKQTRAYIATQGPKITTVKDFWRMVWQEKVHYIVMLANCEEGGKKKCEKYWPDVDTSIEYGNIVITFVKLEVYADYEYRMFDVTCDEEKRKIEQLHFTSWPDHGVPLYPQSLVPFLKKMLTIPQSTAPVVVHCSAGVGRTGTIILCDICLRMAAREQAVDVLRYLHELREQRANMVDNIDQYKLVHMVLLECLLAPDTTIPCTGDISAAVEKLLSEGGLQRQMNYLEETEWQYQALNFASAKEVNPGNTSKNRFNDIVPAENRVYISRYPVEDESADYINAIPVDGFRYKEQFIVTQNPLPNTVKDFWRMILEKEVKVIISLNNIPLDDKTCCIYWPTTKEEMKIMPNISIILSKTQSNDHYEMFSLILQDTSAKDKKKLPIQFVQFKHWNHNEKVPTKAEHLIMLWEESEILTRGDSPMVITCHDGATACGLFVAMTFVIEKIKLEQQCDVCLAVRVVRRNRKQFITDEEQFQFLYKAAIVYLSLFETYSNFQPALKK